MPVLSEQDRAFFDENGYVVVHDAAPADKLAAAVAAIWEFLGMDPDDPDDWYRPPHKPGAGMVEFYQHQALWDNRQSPRVHGAFADIWRTDKLWVSFDRVNMKPPRRPDKPEWDNKGFVHWDADTSQLPLRFGVQGVLCLTDTAANQGGFQCVPGMHNRLEEWVKTQPADRNPRVPDLAGLEVVNVPGKAGDLIIWHRGLPHGNSHNTSDKPRLAQYISMSPASESNDEARARRIELWHRRLPPGPPIFPGDPRRIEEEHGTTAVLTPLGKRLLGLDTWG
ncbi:hypothetical protein FJZ36_03555 [Candidatus Poribacteria bacterium]|nr:hypothetical protein [Candidatus Poribacteria bacterium]